MLQPRWISTFASLYPISSPQSPLIQLIFTDIKKLSEVRRNKNRFPMKWWRTNSGKKDKQRILMMICICQSQVCWKCQLSSKYSLNLLPFLFSQDLFLYRFFIMFFFFVVFSYSHFSFIHCAIVYCILKVIFIVRYHPNVPKPSFYSIDKIKEILVRLWQFWHYEANVNETTSLAVNQ